MIRMTVLYPAAEGATFDHEYYGDVHVPLAVKTWGITRFEIDKGIDGPYVAAVHFFFDSMEALRAATAVDGSAAVSADVPNYTNITPQRQLSEVV